MARSIRIALRPIKKALTGMNSLPRATRKLERKARRSEGFNDKVSYRMAFDRRPILQTFCDKVATREFVARRISKDLLPKTYGIFTKLPATKPGDIPNEFVIKASHGSGSVVLVWQGAHDMKLPKDLSKVSWDSYVVRPENLDWHDLRELSAKWMNQNFYWWPGRYPEWGYKDVPPRIIIEELLLDSDGHPARDFKFFMFEGKCQLIHVDFQRFDDHVRDVFDSEWNLLPLEIKYPQSGNPLSKPPNLKAMIEIAEVLSQDLDFVRVDLYDNSQGIKFGEMTSYPAGGIHEFRPPHFDTWLGTFWNIADYTSANGTRKIH
jgi:hypothetical protein